MQSMGTMPSQQPPNSHSYANQFNSSGPSAAGHQQSIPAPPPHLYQGYPAPYPYPPPHIGQQGSGQSEHVPHPHHWYPHMPPPHPYFPQHFGHGSRGHSNGGITPGGSSKPQLKVEERNGEYGMGSSSSSAGAAVALDSPGAGTPEKGVERNNNNG